jgi:hypothetical protein
MPPGNPATVGRPDHSIRDSDSADLDGLEDTL